MSTADDEFAAFAEIYDAWVATAPITARHVPFYMAEFAKAGGPCVELGVGNGRITIEAARRGVDITGVDVSPAMLALCRERAAAAGVADKIKLIESDMRAFQLPAPAALIAIPFSTIGHCVSLDDKAALFRHVFSQLRPGGLFVFDSLVFDPEYATKHAGVPHLRAETHDEATGDDVVLWVAPTYDHAKQGIRVVAWSDRVGPDGNVKGRRYCRMNFSWIEPAQTKRLLDDAGFVVEAIWGSFDRTAFKPESKVQIWVARKT
jgi:SAM-dependent methyltransferase